MVDKNKDKSNSGYSHLEKNFPGFSKLPEDLQQVYGEVYTKTPKTHQDRYAKPIQVAIQLLKFDGFIKLHTELKIGLIKEILNSEEELEANKSQPLKDRRINELLNACQITNFLEKIDPSFQELETELKIQSAQALLKGRKSEPISRIYPGFDKLAREERIKLIEPFSKPITHIEKEKNITALKVAVQNNITEMLLNRQQQARENQKKSAITEFLEKDLLLDDINRDLILSYEKRIWFDQEYSRIMQTGAKKEIGNLLNTLPGYQNLTAKMKRHTLQLAQQGQLTAQQIRADVLFFNVRNLAQFVPINNAIELFQLHFIEEQNSNNNRASQALEPIEHKFNGGELKQLREIFLVLEEALIIQHRGHRQLNQSETKQLIDKCPIILSMLKALEHRFSDFKQLPIANQIHYAQSIVESSQESQATIYNSIIIDLAQRQKLIACESKYQPKLLEELGTQFTDIENLSAIKQLNPREQVAFDYLFDQLRKKSYKLINGKTSETKKQEGLPNEKKQTENVFKNAAFNDAKVSFDDFFNRHLPAYNSLPEATAKKIQGLCLSNTLTASEIRAVVFLYNLKGFEQAYPLPNIHHFEGPQGLNSLDQLSKKQIKHLKSVAVIYLQDQKNSNSFRAELFLYRIPGFQLLSENEQSKLVQKFIEKEQSLAVAMKNSDYLYSTKLQQLQQDLTHEVLDLTKRDLDLSKTNFLQTICEHTITKIEDRDKTQKYISPYHVSMFLKDSILDAFTDETKDYFLPGFSLLDEPYREKILNQIVKDIIGENNASLSAKNPHELISQLRNTTWENISNSAFALNENTKALMQRQYQQHFKSLIEELNPARFKLLTSEDRAQQIAILASNRYQVELLQHQFNKKYGAEIDVNMLTQNSDAIDLLQRINLHSQANEQIYRQLGLNPRNFADLMPTSTVLSTVSSSVQSIAGGMLSGGALYMLGGGMLLSPIAAIAGASYFWTRGFTGAYEDATEVAKTAHLGLRVAKQQKKLINQFKKNPFAAIIEILANSPEAKDEQEAIQFLQEASQNLLKSDLVTVSQQLEKLIEKVPLLRSFAPNIKMYLDTLITIKLEFLDKKDIFGLLEFIHNNPDPYHRAALAQISPYLRPYLESFDEAHTLISQGKLTELNQLLKTDPRLESLQEYYRPYIELSEKMYNLGTSLSKTTSVKNSFKFKKMANLLETDYETLFLVEKINAQSVPALLHTLASISELFETHAEKIQKAKSLAEEGDTTIKKPNIFSCLQDVFNLLNLDNESLTSEQREVATLMNNILGPQLEMYRRFMTDTASFMEKGQYSKLLLYVGANADKIKLESLSELLITGGTAKLIQEKHGPKALLKHISKDPATQQCLINILGEERTSTINNLSKKGTTAIKTINVVSKPATYTAKALEMPNKLGKMFTNQFKSKLDSKITDDIESSLQSDLYKPIKTDNIQDIIASKPEPTTTKEVREKIDYLIDKHDGFENLPLVIQIYYAKEFNTYKTADEIQHKQLETKLLFEILQNNAQVLLENNFREESNSRYTSTPLAYELNHTSKTQKLQFEKQIASVLDNHKVNIHMINFHTLLKNIPSYQKLSGAQQITVQKYLNTNALTAQQVLAVIDVASKHELSKISIKDLEDYIEQIGLMDINRIAKSLSRIPAYTILNENMQADFISAYKDEELGLITKFGNSEYLLQLEIEKLNNRFEAKINEAHSPKIKDHTWLNPDVIHLICQKAYDLQSSWTDYSSWLQNPFGHLTAEQAMVESFKNHVQTQSNNHDLKLLAQTLSDADIKKYLIPFIQIDDTGKLKKPEIDELQTDNLSAYYDHLNQDLPRLFYQEKLKLAKPSFLRAFDSQGKKSLYEDLANIRNKINALEQINLQLSKKLKIDIEQIDQIQALARKKIDSSQPLQPEENSLLINLQQIAIHTEQHNKLLQPLGLDHQTLQDMQPSTKPHRFKGSCLGVLAGTAISAGSALAPTSLLYLTGAGALFTGGGLVAAGLAGGIYGWFRGVDVIDDAKSVASYSKDYLGNLFGNSDELIKAFATAETWKGSAFGLLSEVLKQSPSAYYHYDDYQVIAQLLDNPAECNILDMLDSIKNITQSNPALNKLIPNLHYHLDTLAFAKSQFWDKKDFDGFIEFVENNPDPAQRAVLAKLQKHIAKYLDAAKQAKIAFEAGDWSALAKVLNEHKSLKILQKHYTPYVSFAEEVMNASQGHTVNFTEIGEIINNYALQTRLGTKPLPAFQKMSQLQLPKILALLDDFSRGYESQGLSGISKELLEVKQTLNAIQNDLPEHLTETQRLQFEKDAIVICDYAELLSLILDNIENKSWGTLLHNLSENSDLLKIEKYAELLNTSGDALITLSTNGIRSFVDQLAHDPKFQEALKQNLGDASSNKAHKLLNNIHKTSKVLSVIAGEVSAPMKIKDARTFTTKEKVEKSKEPKSCKTNLTSEKNEQSVSASVNIREADINHTKKDKKKFSMKKKLKSLLAGSKSRKREKAAKNAASEALGSGRIQFSFDSKQKASEHATQPDKKTKKHTAQSGKKSSSKGRKNP